MSKHVPIRTCVICGTKKNKKELFKIIKSENGNVFDKKQRYDGRSFYLCQNENCVRKISKNKRVQLGADITGALLKQLETGNQTMV